MKYKLDLLFIPLTLPAVTSNQTVKDFQRERVILNNVHFIPDKTNDYRNHLFVNTLNMLVNRLIHLEGVQCIIPTNLLDSRSSTGIIIDINSQRFYVTFRCCIYILPR